MPFFLGPHPPSLPPFLPLSYQLARTSARAERGRAGQRARPRPREGGRKERVSLELRHQQMLQEQRTANSEQRRRLRRRCQKWLLRPRHSPSLPPPPSPGWFYCPKRMEGRDGGKTWPYVRRAKRRGRRMHEARFPFNIFRRVLPLWGVKTGEGGREREGQRRLL